MQTPLLQMGDVLVAPIQGEIDDHSALALLDGLTQRIVSVRARGVLIDISCLDLVDSFVGRILSDIAAMSRLLGAETVVVGMKPAVAITLVEFGLALSGVRTALNVEKGLALLQSPERPARIAPNGRSAA